MAYDFQSWDAGLHSEDPNSLEHYGVLGMKWGQRRYQNSDGSLTSAGKRHYEKTGEFGYHYHSHATKKYTKKAAKAEAKGKTEKAAKFKNRAMRSNELDKREQRYSQQVRAGGNIALRYLTNGMMGGKAYQQHLAMNKDTTSRGSKATAAIMSWAGGRLLSTARKASYIRQDEKAAKRAAKGKTSRVQKLAQKTAAAKAAFENGTNNITNNIVNAAKHKRKR